MRLVSWNVNGIRAGLRKGLEAWVETTQPDLLCLQETKAHPDQLTESNRTLCGRQSHWASAQRAGYSGVATFGRDPITFSQAGLGIERFDAEGRVIRTDIADLSIYNVYFPNGKASPERLAYKYDFYDAFLAHVDAEAKRGRNVIFCGDVNTAHRAIDLARPKENARTSGFLPDERAHLDRWAANGWVDSFRALNGDVPEAYTWWDQVTRARERNVGWRIDYFYVHASLLPRVSGAGIMADVPGSDHCPIWLDID
jgi:exodeoxyribonuclease-3